MSVNRRVFCFFPRLGTVKTEGNDAMQSIRKSSLFCFLASIALAPVSTLSGSPRDTDSRATLVLGQGEQRILLIPGLKRYSIGGPQIRVLPAPDDARESLLLKAIQPGLTDLIVWKSDGSTENRPI